MDEHADTRPRCTSCKHPLCWMDSAAGWMCGNADCPEVDRITDDKRPKESGLSVADFGAW